MRLHLELLLVLVLAAALWFVLETLGARTGRGSESERIEKGTQPALTAARDPQLLRSPSIPPSEPAVEGRRPVHGAPALASEPLERTSRGRLVDEATLEPIAAALVVTNRRNDWTDADGWFDTGDELDGLEELLVLNVAHNTNTYEVPRERWTRLVDGWRVPLAIGPTFRLRFTGLDDPAAFSWEGRLRQERGGEDRWHPASEGPLPYLRYDQAILGLDPGAPMWLEVRSQDALFAGRGTVRSLRGIQGVHVECRARAVLCGRVVDERGLPRAGIQVDALHLPSAGVERMKTLTGQSGTYQLDADEPGRMQVVLSQPSSTSTHRMLFDVPRGLLRAADVVLAHAPEVGSIQGTIQSRSGLRVEATARLRALDGSEYELECPLGFRDARDGAQRRSSRFRPDEFLFEDAPAGRFELSIVSAKGFRPTPSSVEVETPASGIVFTIDDSVPLVRYFLDVHDEGTGAALEASFECFREDGQSLGRSCPGKDTELMELAEGVAFDWCVTAPGHGRAVGTERDFRGGESKRSASVELHSGFGARLVFVDGSRSLHEFRYDLGLALRRRGALVSGVEVRADGVLVGRSDERGIADLELPAKPRRIEFARAGYRALDSLGWSGGELRTSPEAQIWMVRE